MFPRHDDIVIHNLHIRSDMDRQADICHQLQGLYIPPTQRDDEYIFIREMTIHSTTQKLLKFTQEELQNMMDHSVDGNTDQAADSNVIRFTSLPMLLAKLSEDIYSGQADSIWFWKQWQVLFSLPANQALVQLWTENIQHLTTLVHILANQNVLQKIWLSLDKTDAEELLKHAQYFSKLDWPAKRGQRQEWVDNKMLASVLANGAKWLSVTQQLHIDDKRLHLLAFLLLQQQRPDLLAVPYSNNIIFSLLESLSNGHRSISSNDLHEKHSHEKSPERTPLPEHYTADAQLNPDNTILQTERGIQGVDTHEMDKPLSALPVSGGISYPIDQEKQNEDYPDDIKNNKTSFQQKEKEPVSKVIFRQHSSLINEDSGLKYYINQAGVFYLFNVLKAPEVQLEIEKQGGFPVLSGAWGWLYQLAVQMGLKAEPTLQHFFAARLGFVETSELDLLPEISLEPILELARKRYGEVLNARLLQTPAMIRLTPTHLDIDYSLANMRLEVRKAGLDINPGWLFWLGRVVTFHYLDKAVTPLSGELNE